MTKIVFATLLLAPIAFELGRASVVRNIGWSDYISGATIIIIGMWAILKK